LSFLHDESIWFCEENNRLSSPVSYGSAGSSARDRGDQSVVFHIESAQASNTTVTTKSSIIPAGYWLVAIGFVPSNEWFAFAVMYTETE